MPTACLAHSPACPTLPHPVDLLPDGVRPSLTRRRRGAGFTGLHARKTARAHGLVVTRCVFGCGFGVTAQRAGSSPHPWGTLTHRPRAGCGGPVHPHTRGERQDGAGGNDADGGSSPHPWGTRQWYPPSRCKGRFIPTPVGNATAPLRVICATAVHPHTRGERVPRGGARASASGSSPHPWGTPSPTTPTSPELRLIPTPVGNAATAAWAARSESVHPHTRGERASMLI